MEDPWMAFDHYLKFALLEVIRVNIYSRTILSEGMPFKARAVDDSRPCGRDAGGFRRGLGSLAPAFLCGRSFLLRVRLACKNWRRSQRGG